MSAIADYATLYETEFRPRRHGLRYIGLDQSDRLKHRFYLQLDGIAFRQQLSKLRFEGVSLFDRLCRTRPKVNGFFFEPLLLLPHLLGVFDR